MGREKDGDKRGEIINLFSKRKMELAGEILDTEPNSLYQSILFLELYSMEAFRVDELLRYSDEGDPHYYDLIQEQSRLMERIEEEKKFITAQGDFEGFDTIEYTDGKHPEWECEVLEGNFGSKNEEG
tara:strand:- start:426 stop:806 length:381 start_codon:yes stop_codon:yes gene_type:complete